MRVMVCRDYKWDSDTRSSLRCLLLSWGLNVMACVSCDDGVLPPPAPWSPLAETGVVRQLCVTHTGAFQLCLTLPRLPHPKYLRIFSSHFPSNPVALVVSAAVVATLALAFCATHLLKDDQGSHSTLLSLKLSHTSMSVRALSISRA